MIQSIFKVWGMRMLAVGAALTLAACSTYDGASVADTADAKPVESTRHADFGRDRAAILAMAGDFKVTFDFTETAALSDGYTLKPRKQSGGYEIVRVIEDKGDFISLQHILVVGGEKKFPVKHWRQDWVYQPTKVLRFIGGNAWETQPVDASDAAGAWAQIVYQVDDSPRYGAVGRWAHRGDISEWQPPAEWRPLPRRDMTTRDDYHVVDAVNRHTITPAGWVHEQDNTKLVLSDGAPKPLVREIGVNTYARTTEAPVSVATNYWSATQDYWAEVRALWTDVEQASPRFALTLKGEPEGLYNPILSAASDITEGTKTTATATTAAKAVIAEYVTQDVPPLLARLRTSEALVSTDPAPAAGQETEAP